jgi:hypothetical protein
MVARWNTGMSKIRLKRLEDMVWRKELSFYANGTYQKVKLDYHPFLIPNIPLFHYSIIPLAI